MPCVKIAILITILMIGKIRVSLSLECHHGKEEHFKVSGDIYDRFSGRIECNEDYHLCARVHYRAVEKIHGRQVSGHQASCVNASECADSKSCALGYLKDLPVDNGLEITRCKTICCVGNMCNHHSGHTVDAKKHMQEQLKCYSGYKYENGEGVVLDNKIDVRTCSYSSTVPRLDRSSRCTTTELTQINVTTNEKYVTTLSSCVDADMCIDNCETIKKDLAASSNIKVSECKSKCCQENLCNSSDNFKFSSVLLFTSVLLCTCVYYFR